MRKHTKEKLLSGADFNLLLFRFSMRTIDAKIKDFLYEQDNSRCAKSAERLKRVSFEGPLKLEIKILTSNA